jgi:hypothetical protein
MLIFDIECRQRIAFLEREQRWQNSIAVLAQFAANAFPIQVANSRWQRRRRSESS